jgi:HNH endonuclease
MARKTLLLNSTYEVVSFLKERRAIKLLINDKTEVIANWDEEITYASGSLTLPAILRLKTPIKLGFLYAQFSRWTLIKRDDFQCQYCGKILTEKQISMDHILPRSQGGQKSYLNCVVACHPCNRHKGNRTPEQAGMVLLRQPTKPNFISFYDCPGPHEDWHPEWNTYVRL